MLDAVTLDHDQLPYFRKRAKRLRPGSVQDHTITYAWMAGIDAIVRGERNRAIGVSAPDDLDIAGGACTTRCLQRGEQLTKASPRTLAISYSVSDGEGCFE